MLTLYFLDNCFYIHIQLDDHVLASAKCRLANCGEEATIRQTAFCVMAKPREYAHASPLSPVSDSSMYFVESSQINPAINSPVPFPLWDQVHQSQDCPYVNYCKLSIFLPHLHCTKAMYVRDKA